MKFSYSYSLYTKRNKSLTHKYVFFQESVHQLMTIKNVHHQRRYWIYVQQMHNVMKDLGAAQMAAS